MSDHAWVEIKYTPVDVQAEDNGSLTVSVTEVQSEAANEEAAMGCWFCHTPLNTETFATECIADNAESILADVQTDLDID